MPVHINLIQADDSPLCQLSKRLLPSPRVLRARCALCGYPLAFAGLDKL